MAGLGPLGRKRTIVCDPRTDALLRRVATFYEKYTNVKKAADSTILRRSLDLLVEHIEVLGSRLDTVERERWGFDAVRNAEALAFREAGECRPDPNTVQPRSSSSRSSDVLPWMRKRNAATTEPDPETFSDSLRDPRPWEECLGNQ